MEVVINIMRDSYSEVSTLLYSSKAIHIRHPSVLLRLSDNMTPSNFNSISSLHLVWPLIGLPHVSYINIGNYYMHQNELDAMSIWNVISGMKGLKQLNVELNVPTIWRGSWKGWEGILLDCLLEIVGLGERDYDVFEQRQTVEYGLWVPWPCMSLGRDIGSLAKRLGNKIMWS